METFPQARSNPLYRSRSRLSHLHFIFIFLGYKSIYLDDKFIQRIDFQIENKQSHHLKGSFFKLNEFSSKCVIYCHGFNGCRVEAVNFPIHFAEYNINFCCFDFQAAGNSQGEYITFGKLEQFDIDSIILHLKNVFQVQQFILWGRSLGATTICLNQLKKQNALAIIMESPFYDFEKLATRMIQKQTKMPKLLAKPLLFYIKNQIERQSSLDIKQIKLPIDNLKIQCPAFFLIQKDDTVITPKHSQKIYNAYQGQKTLFMANGDHNTTRTISQIKQMVKWCHEQFQKNQQIVSLTPFCLSPQKQQAKGNDRIFNTNGYVRQSKGQTAKELKNSIVNRKSESVMRKDEQQSQQVMEKYQYLMNREQSNQSIEQVYSKYANLGQRKQQKKMQGNGNAAKNLKNTMQFQLRSSEKPVLQKYFS